MNETQIERLERVRHSFAHLLAAAVLIHFPDAKPTIGPATDSGFFYDFSFSEPPSQSDLKKIEKTMRSLLTSWTSFEQSTVSKEEAMRLFAENPYKLELIEGIVEAGEEITLYTSGEFTDLCRGGHVESIKELKADAFELTSISGSYWRGDESKDALTRISGIAFETKEALDDYKSMLEEAKKRDHRKIGIEMDLYTFSDLVGAGLPLFTPKGTIIRTELQKALLEFSKDFGMQPVTIPHIAKIDLYHTSGHAEKFGDELFRVIGHYGQEFVMKPVNCPHHTQIYASKPRSYRDLPIRYMESTMQYRDEKPGEIGGLTRVRAITCDDGHIFCRPDQIKEEAKNIAEIIKRLYSSLGMYGDHWVSLSVRDPLHPEKYIGTDEGWVKAEKMLSELSDELELGARRMEGEAALYGPKLDFMFKDSLGRERQLSTIQFDFAMPARFGLTYTNESGEEETPVMIHRAILGSYERFLAILIEHFAGKFPLWLSPTQIVLIPISETHYSETKLVAEKLEEAGIRVEVFGDNNSLGKRIRKAKLERVPYIGVLGDKEVESHTLTVESRDSDSKEVLETEFLITKLQSEISTRSLKTS
ncbi:MAG: threonine--tRNA ligase [Candidatus Paceibacterota bacterium]